MPEPFWPLVALAVGLVLLIGLAGQVAQNRRLRRAAAELWTEAQTDELTGLWEYRWWRSILENMCRARREPDEHVGVVFFDLDDFKQVNREFGHLRADVVLHTVGRRLLDMPGGWRFGRFGGDEFVGALADVRDDDELDELCEELRRVVAEPVRAMGRDVVVGVTIGRALSVDRDDHPSRVVAHAERDARRRKDARDSRHETPDVELVQGLLDGGLEVVFQPVFALPGRRLEGWEALLRCHQPGVGAVPPLDLVAAARRVGALDMLTLRVAQAAVEVVREACERTGRRYSLGINLESDQLVWENPALEWLAATAPSFPGDLLVEVTERGDGDWDEEQYEVVDDLAAHGVSVALDDYGAGQSRLRALARRRWRVVKLDRDFLTTDAAGVVLLRHNVAAMHALGQPVLLEGLEDERQVRLAADLGVDFVQGHHLGRPTSGERLLAALPSPA